MKLYPRIVRKGPDLFAYCSRLKRRQRPECYFVSVIVILVNVTIGQTSPDVTGTDDGGDPLPLPRSPHLPGSHWSTAPLRGQTLEIHSPMLEMITALCFHCGCGWCCVESRRWREQRGAGPVQREREREATGARSHKQRRNGEERLGPALATLGRGQARPGWSELSWLQSG